MKVTVTLPENISEITLNQYQKFDKLNKRNLEGNEYSKRVISIFTGLKYKDINHIKHTDYEYLLEKIIVAMNKEVKFEKFFKINGVEFGFHPNLNDMTTGEFMDLSKWGTNIENLHRVMAILFRPVINKDKLGIITKIFKPKTNKNKIVNYKISNYNGTNEFADVMKAMPMHVVNGALFFFTSLAKELKMTIQKSIRTEQQKVNQQTTFQSTDGM